MKKRRKLLCGLLKDQRGSTAVITALMLGVLFVFTAFVMDLGIYYTETSRLQNALDSAVLAAARELPANNKNAGEWISAKTMAITLASANGFTITSDNIKPIYENNDSCNIIIGIKITKTISVDYNFARVIGIRSGTATRSASAGLSPVGGVNGAVPLCITATSLRLAIAFGMVNDLTIKCSTDTSAIGIDFFSLNGWFGALDYDGNTGASTFADLLADGYNSALYVGQIVEIETGNMSGPTLDGFTRRYSQCTAGCTSESFESDCPRLCYIPVVQIIDSRHVKIVSFAVFFLETCGGTGSNSYITATYIDDYVIQDSVAGKSGLDFGLYVIKLMS